MSHVFQIPDDLYSEVAAYAAQRGQTPDALLIALVTGGVELLKRVESSIVAATILVGSNDMMSFLPDSHYEKNLQGTTSG